MVPAKSSCSHEIFAEDQMFLSRNWQEAISCDMKQIFTIAMKKYYYQILLLFTKRLYH